MEPVATWPVGRSLSCSNGRFRPERGAHTARRQLPAAVEDRGWHPRYRMRYDFAVLVLGIVSLVVQVVTAFAALMLAFIALRLTAKPGIRVRVHRDGGPAVFVPGEEGDLSIYVELRGFFYGKPTATDLKLTVNVGEEWGFTRLSWTAPVSSESTQVAQGKGLKPPPWWALWRRGQNRGSPSKYLVAERLWLTGAERGETLEATVRAPGKPGRHIGWIHAIAKEGDCGVHEFKLRCRNE